MRKCKKKKKLALHGSSKMVLDILNKHRATLYFKTFFYFVCLCYEWYLPKTRRVEVELVAFALFSTLHLYVPSISFVTFLRSRWDPSSVCFSNANEGRFPSLNFQVTVGFGKPVALQRNWVVLPSGTVWFLGDNTI